MRSQAGAGVPRGGFVIEGSLTVWESAVRSHETWTFMVRVNDL